MKKMLPAAAVAGAVAALAPVASYAALLEPIPNAVEGLKADNAIKEAAWVCCDAYGRQFWVTDAPPDGYYYGRYRRYHDHHHHHHHHNNYHHHHHDEN